ACVKTHTSAKCRKNNSPSRLEPSGVNNSPSRLEPSGVHHLRLLDMQFLQNVSTSAASAGVLTQPRPIADIGKLEIPQCSALPAQHAPGLDGRPSFWGEADMAVLAPGPNRLRCGGRLFVIPGRVQHAVGLEVALEAGEHERPAF